MIVFFESIEACKLSIVLLKIKSNFVVAESTFVRFYRNYPFLKKSGYWMLVVGLMCTTSSTFLDLLLDGLALVPDAS